MQTLDDGAWGCSRLNPDDLECKCGSPFGEVMSRKKIGTLKIDINHIQSHEAAR
jgi:hypothetical protein